VKHPKARDSPGVQQTCELCPKSGRSADDFARVVQVRLFAGNPKGVVSVKFKGEAAAKTCVEKMNGRFFGGRQVVASLWDGFTNYNATKLEETEEQVGFPFYTSVVGAGEAELQTFCNLLCTLYVVKLKTSWVAMLEKTGVFLVKAVNGVNFPTMMRSVFSMTTFAIAAQQTTLPGKIICDPPIICSPQMRSLEHAC